MGFESVGMATGAHGVARNTASAVQQSARPVIDVQTIKTILYLGMKGGIALGSPGGGASPARPSGVDTYA